MNGAGVLGIDLGGTNCRGALVRPDGGLIASRRMETRIGDGREMFLDRLVDFCRELLDEGRDHGFAARALGLGVPGVISGGTVRSSPNLSPLDGVDLAAVMRERLALPVTVVNDANAIAWGEAQYGAGRDIDSFVVLTLGTGVGGALVLNRRLWEGADGSAGEIGHIMVEPHGRPCGCGSRGCLEQYASATGIVASAREALAAGVGGLLDGVTEEELTSVQVASAARAGDRAAMIAFEEAGSRLGQVLAGVANLLNLDAAVLTGGASESFDLMRSSFESELLARAFALPAARLAVVRGVCGDDAGILGASALARGVLHPAV